jgi:hypothetical protein
MIPEKFKRLDGRAVFHRVGKPGSSGPEARRYMAPGAARFKGTDAAWFFDVFIFCGNNGVSSRCCAWGQARSDYENTPW